MKLLATESIQEQAKELVILRTARQQLTGSSEFSQTVSMQMQMNEILDAAGMYLDHLFLIHMIAHHAEAITYLAKNIFHAQSQEIGAIHKLLRQITKN